MEQKKYSEEFELNAFEMYKSGKSTDQICAELNIPKAMLLSWLGYYLIKEEEDEKHRLQKEREDLKLEIKILKKARDYILKLKK